MDKKQKTATIAAIAVALVVVARVLGYDLPVTEVCTAVAGA